MYIRERSEDWDFRNSKTKEFTHGYHSYPAMMIPQIARKLINEYSPNGELNLLFDPYMGSGTSLVEASVLGINSIGTDINPLACLISKVKTTYYNNNEIDKAFSEIQYGISKYKEGCIINVDFGHITNHDYWYSSESLYKLSYLTQLIENIDLSIKDFFKVALAEVVREVSFSRNGEFKRFRMMVEQIESFNPDVFNLFKNKIIRNIKGLNDFNTLKKKGIAKTYSFNSSIDIPQSIIGHSCVDMVVTSPPYGDSKTTVAYGQFSRWANEWFKFENAKKLDTLLMGGKTIKEANLETDTIKDELNSIKKVDIKRYLEVISFLSDYKKSIENVAKTIRIGGTVCYVVGNRTVKGVQVPLDYFTAEIFEKNNFKHEITFIRSIPNKRMPSKNSPTNKTGQKVNTMNNEYIVILSKNKK